MNRKGLPNTSVYAATKAALRTLARTLANELAPRGTRVNAIAPGAIETPIYQRLGMPDADLKAFAADIESTVPLGRFGSADELARAAVFLISDEASYVTGAEMSVDGGFAQV